MPNKTCPNCNLDVHVRTSICKCKHVFYVPVRKLKPDQVTEVKVVVTDPVLTIKKITKDPILTLSEEATALGYTIKDLNKKETDIQKRFFVYKVIGNHKYAANHSKAGRISGITRII